MLISHTKAYDEWNSNLILNNSWSCLYKKLISHDLCYVCDKRQIYSRKGLKLSTDGLDMRSVSSLVGMYVTITFIT